MKLYNRSSIVTGVIFKKAKYLFLFVAALFYFVSSNVVLADSEEGSANVARKSLDSDFDSNPLLQGSILPAFDKILAEHFKSALVSGIEENRAAIEEVLRQKRYTWDNFVIPLDDAIEKLNMIWNTIYHLEGVVGSDEIKRFYEEHVSTITECFAKIDQDERIGSALKQILESDNCERLNPIQKKILADKLHNFRLAGGFLSSDKKARLIVINRRLNELGGKFSHNVLDATQSYSLKLTEEEAMENNLPPSAISLGRENAKKKNQDGLIFTLDRPSYEALRTFASSRALREKVYMAYVTRASDRSVDKDKDNSEIIEEILELRKELAKILGFSNFAEYAISTQTAKDTNQVIDFLFSLVEKALPKAKKEVQELKEIALEDGIDQIEGWDIHYYTEKLKQKKFKISQEEIRAYFPAPHVLKEVFNIIEPLYGITFKENNNTPVWHKDVKFFEIYDCKNNLQGYIYIDMYSRENKQVESWMDKHAPKRYVNKDGEITLPMTYLVYNFSPPVGGKPSLLTHGELINLLHEIGHSLQHLLTKVDYISVSGLYGIPLDGQEVASRVLENWAWNKDILKLLSKHYQTGEQLPEETIEKLLATRKFQAGIDILHHTELSLIDFTIHLEQATKREDIERIVSAVRERARATPFYEHDRFLHSFQHVFVYKFAARYYSYLWSEVIAADLFSEFEEKGIFDHKTNEKFLHHILEPGGSEQPLTLYDRFLGRAFKVDSFLRHYGVIESDAEKCTLTTY